MSTTFFAPPSVADDTNTAPPVEFEPLGSADTTATDSVVPDGHDGHVARSRWQRIVRGPEDDPRWARPALAGLLLATGVLYIWGLGASGWANSFYSAAVQAGTKSWKAFFFGSSDAANFITVDKPPASLWIMEISGRIFGVNSWSILVPQALEGVAAVGLLYATVRRWFGAAAGLIAGAVMALTPVAVLMFRFNNPDALLVLLMVGAAYALTRSLENGSTKWLVLVGVLIGFGFLTKMLQAFVIVPGFAVTYLVAGPPKVGKRLLQLLASGLAMFAAAGWWVALVELWPKSSRPYIGGSENNSVLNLIFGYNGLGRVTGNETGSVGGGGQGGTGMWGPTGWLRMFNTEFGGQASWLIPAALLLGAAGLAFTIRRPRIDRSRAALLLWGSWLAVTAIVFSLSAGIIHPYYTVALAPAIGALIGIGGHLMWKRRRDGGWRGWAARSVLAAAVLVSMWWAYELLNRTPDWHPWLRGVVVFAGVIGAAALLFGHLLGTRTGRIAAIVGVSAALVAGLAGPSAYALDTAQTTHAGSLPSAGPSSGSIGRGGFPGGAGRTGNRGGFPGGGGFPTGGGTNGQPPSFPGGGGGNGGGGNGQFPNFPGGGTGTTTGGGTTTGAGTTTNRPTGGFGGGGAGGGLLNASTPSAELVAALDQNASDYTWVLATIGANNASGYQLATGDPVMAIGGFNGTDPTPTLAAFQAYVTNGQIHYYVAGGTGGRSSSSSEITGWVEANFTAVTIGGQTLYDFTQPL